MSSPYQCPNGHDVDAVSMHECSEDACHALVTYVPLAHATMLMEHLGTYAEFTAESDLAMRRFVRWLVALNIVQAALLTLVVLL